jgi:serine/threonine protein kinase
MLPAPGMQFGPYEVLAKIGSGAMGEAWRARDPRLNREVAIKTSHAKFSKRFAREAQVIAALNHSHICQIYDVGLDYLVMELVDGAPVKGPKAQNERSTKEGTVFQGAGSGDPCGTGPALGGVRCQRL